MNKRKLLTLAMAMCMAAILAIGGTLAYFTDTDTETNTFTIGDVDIEIVEVFEQESELMPGKDVQKEVDIENIGSEEAYVRVHVAVPYVLADANLNSFNNMLHLNFSGASVGEGEWSWIPAAKLGHGGSYAGWIGNGAANYNYYTDEIDGEDHVVFVITYTSKLAAGATTATNAIDKVYLDQFVQAVEEEGKIVLTKPNFTDRQGGTVDGTLTYEFAQNEDGAYANDSIKIFAEAVQAEGFYQNGAAIEAYNAFDASYKAVGDYNPFENEDGIKQTN